MSHTLRWLVPLSLALAGCGLEPLQTDHGGVAEQVSAPLGEPLPFASAEQLAAFDRGRALALERFGYGDGLGPAYNVSYCGACHHRPVLGGGAELHRNVFVGGVQVEGGGFVPLDSAGASAGFVRQYHSDPVLAHPALAAEVDVIAQRNPPPLFGVGLLLELDEDEILKRADPDDADGDGISGRPNYHRGALGRFGRKAQSVSLQGLLREQSFVHAGLTSDPLSETDLATLPMRDPPADPRTSERVRRDDDDGDDPELAPAALYDLLSFTMLLAAPAIDLQLDEQAARGRTRFDLLGCRRCHTPRLDGPRGPLPVYSDLLLHDMGDGLADGIVIGDADGSEFRTQPLWGIGAGGPYLHDGRAGSIEAAILWHGGEARAARDGYAALDRAERDELLSFLRSLGGEPPAAPGDAGAALFERTFGFDDGLGAPRFEGNSCRGCHFDPVVGGAGPRGVSTIRQAIIDNYHFSEPPGGSALPRLTRFDGDIARADEDANQFELRQPPALFGLGLIDGIAAEAIAAHADPDDTVTADGISGRALGRFGYKGQYQTLEQAVRASVAVDLGLSDDELDAGSVASLIAFVRQLAPPAPSVASDPQLAEQGEELFTSLGCASCHVPTLPGESGPVKLYSDLLVHEIIHYDAFGIEEGAAEMREFRTTPLWGVRHTAPYLHDGRADTLHQAILAHEGEGAAARDAYGALPQSVRAALIVFLETL